MRTLHGKPVSPGYARGQAFVYNKDIYPQVPCHAVDPQQVPDELGRFQEALERSTHELEALRDRLLSDLGQAEAEIFSAHLAMINDRQFISRVKDRISQGMSNVECAVEAETHELISTFSQMNSEYLRERAKDVHDVGRRLLKHLGHGPEETLHLLPPGSVLVARELLPSDTLSLNPLHVTSLVMERGGGTSHTAILARSLGIPAITDVVDATELIAPGTEVIVDSQAGIVVLAADLAEMREFLAGKEQYEHIAEEALAGESQACVTQDGLVIQLLANIGRAEEAPEVIRHHLEGVGLFRTEYLFLQSREPPSMDLQREAYSYVLDQLPGVPVVIRTFDLGGDKKPLFLLPHFEANPNIGLRGLRFALMEGTLFRTQLRAILQAARGRHVSVLFPMVLGQCDFAEAIDNLKRAAQEAGVDALPRIGVLIETPSALFELDDILKQADFVSIGTNDLVQFMLAADRNATNLVSDESVLQPGVLRAISMVIRAADEHGCPVSVCGEAAGNPEIAALLVGLGIRQLSMSPLRSARVRYAIRQCRASELQTIADTALHCGSAAQVIQTLRDARLTDLGKVAV